jgi:secreted trypsin-like serine protease
MDEVTKTKTVIGVLSLGQGCETGKHTGYTRITSYLDWIKQQTGINIIA